MSSWAGQRDQVLLSMLYNTGARVSETRGIMVADVKLENSPCVRLHGGTRITDYISLGVVAKTFPVIDQRLDSDYPSPRCPDRPAQENPGSCAAGILRPADGPLRSARPHARSRHAGGRRSGPAILSPRRARGPPQDGRLRRYSPRHRKQFHDVVLAEILQERAVSSRNRRNPRGVKRKMSNFPLCRLGGKPMPSLDIAAAIRILK